MKFPPDIRARLSRVGSLDGSEVGLAETALILGSIERPRVVLAPYLRHLERMCAETAAYAGDDPDLDLGVESLRQVIARRYGYAGRAGAADDPEAANLTRVIDRRSGLPVALGILYLHVARSLGWRADGLAFPPRFLVRLEMEDRRLILDPFDGGRELSARNLREMFKAAAGNHAELTPGHYLAMTNHQILVRLQDHIKTRLLCAERTEDALAALETMVLFAPMEGRLWREMGLLHARLNNVQAAVVALERYLGLNPEEGPRCRTSELLQELRGRLG